MAPYLLVLRAAALLLTLLCCTVAQWWGQGFDEWSQKMASDPGVPWEQREEKAVGRWVAP
jgi:hypothetical protein